MTPQFQEALAALDRGDVPALERLLTEHPAVLRERAEHAEPYFRRPFLLWYVAENPVRNGQLPPNIAEVARTIVEAARRERVDSLQRQMDYALALVASGRVPREAGVQGALIDVLADAGADTTAALDAALAHRERAAVDHLLRRGARGTLTLAAARGEMAEIARLAPDAGPRELQAALIAAALEGQAEALTALIRHGAQVDGYGPDGFHPHATALHQAVYTGSMDAVKTLVDSGATLSLKDSIHEATPLGWAEHMQRTAIADYLRQREKAGVPVVLAPRRVRDLLVRPSRFFANRAALDRTFAPMAAALAAGVAEAVSRLAGRTSEEAQGSTWLGFWTIALLAGMVGAVSYWWIGGWWCRMRLRWSGAAAPEPRLARLLLMYASLVDAGPVLLAAVWYTLRYPSPGVAFAMPWLLMATVLIFWPWSCVTMYRGARTLFSVRPRRAAVWFLALPLSLGCLTFGAVLAHGFVVGLEQP